jgi:hypothetical protein
MLIPYIRFMFHQALSILFALFLLFADSGQMLYAHTCHHANLTTFSVNDLKLCCGACASDEAEAAVKASSCCDIKTQWLKQNYLTDTQIQSSPQIHTPILSANGEAYVTISLTAPQATRPLAQGNSPPLHLASSDIRFTQTFRI